MKLKHILYHRVVHYLNYDKYKHDYRDINDLQS